MDEDGNEQPWAAEAQVVDADYETVHDDRAALPSGIKHLPEPESEGEDEEEYPDYEEPEA